MASIAVHLVAVLACVYALLRYVYGFAVNWRKAKTIGLPIVTSPVYPFHPAWVVSQKLLLPVLRRVPFNLGLWMRFNYRGWQYDDKCALHQELGDAWVMLSPGINVLYLSDTAAIEDVFNRRKDFMKPSSLYKPLELFGPNVLTAEKDVWQRHRKVTAPPFNSQKNEQVWNESIRQANQMLEFWMQGDESGIGTIDRDLKVLTMHVLTHVGLGISYTFRSAIEPPKPGTSVSYRDDFSLIIAKIYMAVAMKKIPRPLLDLPIWPRSWKAVGEALISVEDHIRTMTADARELRRDGLLRGGNLLHDLVSSSTEFAGASADKIDPARRRKVLTDTEISSNLFVIMLAGHETTGNALVHAIYYLAIYPEWQSWIAEEIQRAMGRLGDSSDDFVYTQCFPHLVRCRAVLLETLRLVPPISSAPKYTGSESQPLNVAGKMCVIPPHTMVLPNMCAMHMDPRYWGPDAHLFRPSRWIQSSGSGNGLSESLLEPPKGVYFPWSEGLRICPGKGFSQAEFAAVLAVLFRDHSVHPVCEQGEGLSEAQERFRRTMDEHVFVITLQIKGPERLRVRWQKRMLAT